MLIEGESLSIRLFSGEGDDTEWTVSFSSYPESAALVEMDGRTIRQLEIGRDDSGCSAVRLSMSRLGLRALKLSGLRGRQ